MTAAFRLRCGDVGEGGAAGAAARRRAVTGPGPDNDVVPAARERDQYQRYQALALRLLVAATRLRMAKRSFITAPPFGGDRAARAPAGADR
ncbi:hypothetical protein GCM10010503_55170 [Streptomyces lucensis JCM 4490]|uniref:Uncharacterized protein n=1 Tax=Streptomyces lucensis JCM 4490 TaxID=1306176 RepID=A0A918JBJ3_9ACTN|nr:hypothetical protein GCM10010503_55170 [Streptomyces lucensis JCM 4490]